MPLEGPIAAAARRTIPVTWDALAQDERYGGEGSLREVVDYIKERMLGVVTAPDAEALLPRMVHAHLGKLIALELISPGIDFWMNQSLQETARPDESVLYANRANELRLLREQLLQETRRDEADVIALIPNYPRASRRAIPRTNTVNDEFITPSHQEFPRPFRATTRS